MNIVEMKMMNEYYENDRSILDDIYPKKVAPSFDDKQEWLKNNVSIQNLMEYALDNVQVINILYEHFHK